MSLIHFIKKSYRSSRQKRWNRLFDHNHHIKVAHGLEQLAKQGLRISAENSRKANEYAQEALGSLDFAPWLILYSAFRGEFLEGWIPDNYLGRVVCPAVNGNYRITGELKTISRRVLETDALPDLAYRINDNWISLSGKTLDMAELKQYLFDQHETVFLKKNESFQGKGVVKLNAEQFSKYDLKAAGDFVIQKTISQHSFFEEISPGSVATLRITTVKPLGQKAKNRLARLRVGLRGMTFIESASCIRIPVWPETGAFDSRGISANWELLDAHPDTGVVFSDLVVPHYAEAVRLCEELHDRFAHFQLIGWDVAIEQDGSVKLMEWNTDQPGIVYSESSIGPNFKGLGWENLWKSKKP